MESIYDPSAVASLYARYVDFDLIVDSRRVTRPGKSLFFALPGRATHGAAFIGALYASGVRQFVLPTYQLKGARTQVPSKEAGAEDWTFVVADDPVEVLQALGIYHRRKFSIPVVGITGSNGKTIVKDWLAEVLATKYKVCASPRSYNSQIGVPLSVWQLAAHHEVAVFEAGVSKAGEMEKLAEIIRPTHGVFTMLGAAHDAGFPSVEAKLREKLLLFRGAERVVAPTDETDARKIIAGMGVAVEDRLEPPPELTKLPKTYRENAAATATAAAMLGIDEPTINRILPTLDVLQNRLEQTEGRHGAPVINDSYSNDVDALAAAIEYASSQSASGEIHLVLGAMQNFAPSFRHGTRGSALNSLLDRVVSLVTVGKDRPLAPVRGRSKVHHYPTIQALLRALPELRFEPLPILVKGASRQRLGRVAQALSRKQHRTDLRVDLGAIQHNFRVYRDLTLGGLNKATKRVMPKPKMIVMVKASAYGGGSLPIARAVTEAGADYLAVAYTDEGKELRRGGLELPIMVLNPEPAEFADLVTHQLEPVVGNSDQLALATHHGLRVHLEVDTGMARLGFSPTELLSLNDSAFPEIASVFSHLVASGAPEHAEFTNLQYRTYQAAYEELTDRLGYLPMRHLANSNGISHREYLQLDAVRLGIGLYGVGDYSLKDRLRPALQLTTRVAGVKHHPAGTTIGYDRKGKLTRDSTVATLSIGYADGLPRLAGNNGFNVLIAGQPAPIVGAVCMDMTMVDVTDIVGVTVGMKAEVFGTNQPVAALAEAAETIVYEIFTGIGPRVHRIYVRE